MFSGFWMRRYKIICKNKNLLTIKLLSYAKYCVLESYEVVTFLVIYLLHTYENNLQNNPLTLQP